MKIRTGTLREIKQKGMKFACLTSYDQQTAQIFDEAGIELILVGDSASNTVLAHDTTIPVTLDEMIPFGQAVARSAKQSLVIFDMPFGSYELNSEQALGNAVRVLKETGVAGVKIEGRRTEQIKKLVENGIPVMGHVGFTPQTVHGLSGYKVQGRLDDADRVLSDAIAIQEAGAFAIVLELVPAELAEKITKELAIPTIGIGAGNATDGQILVWTDFAGLGEKIPSFARRYLSLREDLSKAAVQFAKDVKSGNFPSENESFR
ncbi:MAG: 3-methyl-2-oxobutanoate hydroxymethyltransferase [Actinobacteria bacterium]|uniref:3-methyl-2-oxobutanoate hydroxymethyltransferase n=1 Tax=freshwater metagenome TaxID=449393 RepID=A0A6J6C5L8_9ZZZZ|nr:3-methyl-2-oxobutanoate hydroxymethyltransferase [Actinomycetota bacterium]MTA89947.1 3-methyl-2-oxobutanoate hydroxymethyltransferase [Actinomycetota bacterium]